MDFQVMNRAVPVNETLFDDFDERPVDCDFVLPDYCPDIAAVLKCTLKPVIQSKQLSGDRLLVDGQATIRVMYLDEGRKCVRCCEFSQPFTSTFSVKNAGVNACIRATAKTDYVNCRATSPRRLDVHGAFTVKLKITAQGSREVVNEAKGAGMYTRCACLSTSVPAASAEKTFSISEVLDLGSGHQPAEALIRGEAVPRLTDCKLLANKAILKGDIQLKNLYASDVSAGTMETVRHEIPFSQIVDVEGLSDEWLCEVSLSVVASDIHITANQNGENCLLSVTIKLLAQLQCTATEGCEVVTDAYSAQCPLHLETGRLDARHLTHVRRDTSVVKEAFELPPDGVSEIVDVWCEASPLAERCEDGRAFVDGRMLISLLARDPGGAMAYYERPADFTLAFDERCDSMDADLQVTQVEYAIVGGKVELRVELDVARSCYEDQNCLAVTAVSADENASFPPEKAALKIYYAAGGESIWEIAKKCHTSMQAVMEENNLSGEILPEDTMLLVPLC